MQHASSEPSIDARHRLESALVRARWLGAAAVTLVALIGDAAMVWVVVLGAGLAAANVAIASLNRRVRTLSGQRLLGLSATLVDAAALFGVAASVGTGLVPSVYALFALVAGVAAVRYTPMKTTLASIGLSGALAGAMAVRSARDGMEFDFATFVFWGVLILLVGIGAGTAIREVYRQRVAAQSDPSALPQELTAALTPRERQVLSLIAEGYSNAGIAEALVIEHKTVKNHINRLYAKLELGGRYEAIARVVAGRAGYDDAAP